MPITYTVEKRISFDKSEPVENFECLFRVRIDSSDETIKLPFDCRSSSCNVSCNFLGWAETLQNLKIRSDDIWVDSFSKAGTTWIMNIIRQLIDGLDFTADYVPADYMYLDKPLFFEKYDNANYPFKEFDERASPRLIKSHLPAFLLPTNIWTVKPKMIYTYRDAKDVVLSMYHMYSNIARFRYIGTKEEFFDNFLENDVVFGPFHDHVDSFLQLKGLDHVLLVKYEDMLNDPFAGVKRISEFLNYSYSDDQLKQLTDYVSFKKMQQKNVDKELYINGFNFFRKGKAGAYLEEMSPEYIQKFDEWERKYSKQK